VTFRGGGAGISCHGISSPLVAECDDPQVAMTRIAPWRPRKALVPGVVSHATNVVEHPEVVADRILNFARVVGRENVIAGTDCGLGGRIHPQLVWAKLAALVEGAKLATKELYGS